MSKVLMTLGLLSILGVGGCGNKDYDNCIKLEQEKLAALPAKLDTCDAMPDEAKRKHCKEAATSLTVSGCDALK